METSDWVYSIANYMGYVDRIAQADVPPGSGGKHKQPDLKLRGIYTVGELIDDWLSSTYAAGSVQPQRIKDFLNRLVIPEIGAIEVHHLTDSTMRALLDKIGVAQNKPATSRLCRRWLRAAIRFAKAHRRISREAFCDLMDVPAVKHRTKHKRPLRPDEIRNLWWDLEKLKSRQTVLGVRLLLLTFVRPTELRSALWQEFDTTSSLSPFGPIWIVPSERVKMRTPHIVPLSSTALALLEELRTLTGDTPFLFPGARRDRAIVRQTWMDALRRLDWHRRFSPHACRATASTLLRELELGQNDHIEIQLGHLARSETRASYDFSTCLRQRYSMMQNWSTYIAQLVRTPSDRLSRRATKDVPRMQAQRLDVSE
jgi:integrase